MPRYDEFIARHRGFVEIEGGTSIEVRPLIPEDADLLRRGFEHLSQESRRRRFLRPMRRLSDREVRYFTEIDYVDHFAWGAKTRGLAPEGIGVARYVRDGTDPASAEMAVVIADDWQGKGIGTMLMELLIVSAGERGIERFSGSVAAENEAGRRLMLGLGAHGRYSGGLWECELILAECTSRLRGTPQYTALLAAAEGRGGGRARRIWMALRSLFRRGGNQERPS